MDPSLHTTASFPFWGLLLSLGLGSLLGRWLTLRRLRRQGAAGEPRLRRCGHQRGHCGRARQESPTDAPPSP